MFGSLHGLEVLNCIFVAEGSLDLKVDRSRLILLGEFKAEGVERKDGIFLRAVGEPVLSYEGFLGVIELVAFNLVLGEPCPEADVNHDVPEGEVQSLHQSI